MSDDIMYTVVQKATRLARSPLGRPRSFDAEAVVGAAVGVFWRCGYEAASLTELEQELGVGRSTIYNSFGGKEGLFRAAIDAYLSDVDAELFAPLRDGAEGLADLIAFAERQRLLLTDPALPAGCLLVNAMVTGDAPEATRRYLQNFRSTIDAALERAGDREEITADARPALAGAFLSSVLGCNVAAKSGATVGELHEMVDGICVTVRSWAVGPTDALGDGR